jgi:hypothetical protein
MANEDVIDLDNRGTAHGASGRLESNPQELRRHVDAERVGGPEINQQVVLLHGFMDELAAAAGADPLEFRLKYLDPKDKRGIEVLDRLARFTKWEKRPPRKASGNTVKGRGISYRAFGAHCQFQTHAVQQRTCRGRDASCLAPPAQIRTCSFPAYGSHLGYRRQ